MTATAHVQDAVEARSPAESYNLLRSLDELAAVLLKTIAGGYTLDAYLIAAGMQQILADELHPDPLRLDEAGQVLGIRQLGWCAQLAQLGRQLFVNRAVVRCERGVAALVGELASGSVSIARAAEVVESCGRLPARVQSAVLRLPACFHDFDQRPEDLERLALDFSGRYPDRTRPLVVVGVRTSGSYLAPLQAAYLRAAGFERVDVITVRPGRRLLGHEREVLRRDALAIVVDDPPGTGRSLARVIRALRVPAANVVLLLQLFENQQLPAALSEYAAVCLTWREWSIHRSLPGKPLPAGRGHARALGRNGLTVGSGVGYFGRAEAAIEEALAAAPPSSDEPEAIAAHVKARAAALPVREDFSLRMAGDHPAWEVASNMLSRAFARAGPVVKVFALDAAARRLSHVQRPSLTECSTWHLGLSSFDPLHDLAGAAAGRDRVFVDRLLDAYGEVDPERFLLHELGHLWCRQRLQEEDVRGACAAAVRRYVGRRFLADTRLGGGPVVALDIDGVLETAHLGFPATTRSGALALRALLRHGYRPLLVSGRSAGDVAERVADYGLAGGVAEYGGAIVVDGEARGQLDDRMHAALDLLRGQVESDPGYRYSVRAYGPCPAAVDGLRAIHGDDQTDFVPNGIDKATGLRTLLAELDADRLAFAVGDTEADLPMLELADDAAVPRHSSVRRGRVGRPYQSGLAQAVERLIGHAPGACPDCRVELDERAELLLTALSAQERGRLGIVRAALRLRRLA